MDFTIVGCLFVKKIKNKFLLASMYSSTNKIVPKTGPDMFSGENGPMRQKESQNGKLEEAFGTIFRISMCFHEASRNFVFIYSFIRHPKML